MKKLFLSGLIALSALNVSGQFNYTFSKHVSYPYVPLTAGTSVNGNIVWDDESFRIPIGFSVDMDGISIDSIGIYEMRLFGTDTQGVINAFLPVIADLCDRNSDTGTIVSRSPIRYLLTGTTPNRIFKLEMFNAGFYDELDLYNTMNDSVNFQFWLYEGSNIAEFRIGHSFINHPADYYANDSAALNMGYMKQLDLSNFAVTNFYFLKGDTAAPAIDSINNLMDPLNEGLNGWPSYGTVYRFEPPVLSVRNAMTALKQVTVYPTIAQQELFVENSSDEAANYTILAVNGAATNLEGSAPAGKSKIDVSALPTGNYAIQLSNRKIARAVKFTKL